jgi:hypothetical protein
MFDQDSITFGKYNGLKLNAVLRDRSYCNWLLEQEWFQTNYEYLYNRVRGYDPKIYFLNAGAGDQTDFIDSYPYFNLTPIEQLEIELHVVDMACYGYYLEMLNRIRQQVYERMENEEDNPYNIKAPTRWLQLFESRHGIPRGEFKEFLNAYELPNIPYIIERIKKEGGIEYKGAQSFKIAKARSEAQEKWWEVVLKEKYGENLGTQFKYKDCVFDFVNIPTQTIFECKLGVKDFDEQQHHKYRVALEEFRIIYLIGRDAVIDIEKERVYTSDPEKYGVYMSRIPAMKTANYLDHIITEFELVSVQDLSTLFGLSRQEDE